MPDFNDLAKGTCSPCTAATPPLGDDDVAARLQALGNGWAREGVGIVKTYRFSDYYKTIAFVNAIAWISHRTDHHPDLTVGYGRCRVFFSTHAIGGLSENDFISAAKVEALLTL